MKKCFIMLIVFVLMLFLGGLMEDSDEIINENLIVSVDSVAK